MTGRLFQLWQCVVRDQTEKIKKIPPPPPPTHFIFIFVFLIFVNFYFCYFLPCFFVFFTNTHQAAKISKPIGPGPVESSVGPTLFSLYRPDGAYFYVCSQVYTTLLKLDLCYHASYLYINFVGPVLLHAEPAGIVDSRPDGLADFLLIFAACTFTQTFNIKPIMTTLAIG